MIATCLAYLLIEFVFVCTLGFQVRMAAPLSDNCTLYLYLAEMRYLPKLSFFWGLRSAVISETASITPRKINIPT